MIPKISFFLRSVSKPVAWVFIILVLTLVGAIDFITGPELHLSLFYLVPIALASWFISSQAGSWVSILIAGICLLADVAGGRVFSSPFTQYWNFLMRAGVYVVVANILAQLRLKLDALTELAERDFLTGLPNGRAFYQLVAREMETPSIPFPYTLAYVDMTGFKWVNNRFGYAAGDQMICVVAQTIKDHVGRPDLIGRVGGTSFAVLLPETSSAKANFILEEVLNALKEQRKKYAHPITFSISALTYAGALQNIAELMDAAERRLSRVKPFHKDILEIETIETAPMMMQ